MPGTGVIVSGDGFEARRLLDPRVMHGYPILASAESWFSQNNGWITPFAAAVAALATVGTVVVALFINYQAGKVAASQLQIAAAQNDIGAAQRTISGLAGLSQISDEMNQLRYLLARQGIARGYLEGNVEDKWAGDLLDLMEGVSIYEDNRLITIDVLTGLYSALFICWWYASENVVRTYRQEVHDPMMWIGTERLVGNMHVAISAQSPEWAQRPSDELMKKVLTGDIDQTSRLLTLLPDQTE
jgi:hypothetical protein